MSFHEFKKICSGILRISLPLDMLPADQLRQVGRFKRTLFFEILKVFSFFFTTQANDNPKP
jgi:hypothetical protein